MRALERAARRRTHRDDGRGHRVSRGGGRKKRARDLTVGVWLVFVGVLGWSARGARAATAIQGVGASFPSTVYFEAMNAYEQATEGVSVDYKAFGSGSGLCRIRDASTCTDSSGTSQVDFACSDSLLSSSDYSTYNDLQMYPMVAGAVVVAYNLPTGVGDVPLRVNDTTLADIFRGAITHWNDAALVALNAGLSLPNQQIKVVLRSDSSGTTDVFTGALSELDNNFNSDVGRTTSWNTASLSPAMATRGLSIGVASYVRATEYSIGYVVLADAKLVNASIAGYMHAGASSPVFPNSDSIAEAVKTRGLQFGNNGDSPNRLTATVAPVTTNPLAWPFTTYSYVVLRTGIDSTTYTSSDRLRTGASCAHVKETVAFWRWFLTSEQSSRIADRHGFATLRDEVGALVLARLIGDIYCNGERVANISSEHESPSTAAKVYSIKVIDETMLSLRALYEAYNATSTLEVSRLDVLSDTMNSLITDNGFSIGMDLVGEPLAALQELPLFSVEARFAVNDEVLNLGSGGTSITLDLAAAAAILSGTATTWGHSEIVRLNSFLSGVTTSIKLITPESYEEAFYQAYIEQFKQADANFQTVQGTMTASSYFELASFVVETNYSIAMLPLTAIKIFDEHVVTSSSLAGMSAVDMKVHLLPELSGDQCAGEKFETAYSSLHFLEWMAVKTDIAGILSESGVTPAFAASDAVLNTYLEELRGVTCDGVSILAPETVSEKSSIKVTPLILALSIGLGLITVAMTVVFGGNIAKSFFVQTILNQYKRTHAPPDSNVTIVVTDVQASTKLWQRSSVYMNRALAVHDKIMRTTIQQTYGYEVLTEGDSFIIAFHDAVDAIRFAMIVQERLNNYQWDAPMMRSCEEIYGEGDRERNMMYAGGSTGHLKSDLDEAIGQLIPEDSDDVAGLNGLKQHSDADASETTPQTGTFHFGMLADEGSAKINGLRVRIGIHSGFCSSRLHPTTRRKEYYRGAVTIAHAISECARGGQTLISGDTMAAIVDASRDEAKSFHTLHMGKHQVDLSAVELEVHEDAVVLESDDSELDKSGLHPDENVVYMFSRDAQKMRLRQSSSDLSTEDSSIEYNPAYKYMHRKKVSVVKNLSKNTQEKGLVQTELVQAVPKTLSGRLSLFTSVRTVRQIEPSYFDAPGFRSQNVTIIFTYIDALKELTVALKEVMDESIDLLNATIRATLRVYNGYECRESNGEFLLAFHTPSDAFEWALLAQTALMQLDWPKLLLTHRSARRMQTGKYDVFVGLRVGMGICSGPCTDIRPCTRTGRSEYFGHLLNLTARIARSANGGQILTDANTFLLAQEHGRYSSEFCHPLGTYKLKGINDQIGIIQISDASLMLRSFGDLDATHVEDAAGDAQMKNMIESRQSDISRTRARRSCCVLLCEQGSTLKSVVQSVVRAIRAEVNLVVATSTKEVCMALRRLDIPGQPVNAPFLIISDELEGLSGSEACVSVRRNVPLRVQPNIAIYMSSLEGKSIAEVGADVALPGLDANENGSTSRSSYVDHEDDSDDEDDLLDFKSAVEAFLTGRDASNAGSVRRTASMSIEHANLLAAERLPATKTVQREQRPVQTSAPHRLSMNTINLLSNTLEASGVVAMGIDSSKQVTLCTRAALKSGIGKSSSDLPSSEWLERVGSVASMMGRGIVRQPWSENVSSEWLNTEESSDSGDKKVYENVKHTPMLLGEDFAIVIITFPLTSSA